MKKPKKDKKPRANDEERVKSRCRIDDDGGPEVVVIEAGNDPQALWIRVGPVYDNTIHTDSSEMLVTVKRKEPGIWVEYQGKHMESELCGPVLLTPKVWRRLNKIVEESLEGWK